MQPQGRPKIILLRHGEPEVDTHVKVSPGEYSDWLKTFNQASIKVSQWPTLTEVVEQCTYVVCSDLTRSIDSARALGVEKIDMADRLFREFEIPSPQWSFPKLSASNWTIWLRLLWLAGYSANAESFTEARQRAALCMQSLTESARLHGTVLFVGHGALNWYLNRLLLKNGWQASCSSPRRHWDYSIYSI